MFASWREAARRARYWCRRDYDGVPKFMLAAARDGHTLTLLCLRTMGVPWSKTVFRYAVWHGQLRTAIWLQLFGCPWDLEGAALCPRTACLRWLLQYRQPDGTELITAADEGNLECVVVLLQYPHDVTRRFGRLLPCRVRVRPGGRRVLRPYFACAAVMAGAGFVCMSAHTQLWRTSSARLRLVEAVPGAAARFHARHRAARAVQRWWTAQYYTPGATAWRRRMLREFAGLQAERACAAGQTPLLPSLAK